jgi:hypothetical protein
MGTDNASLLTKLMVRIDKHIRMNDSHVATYGALKS